MSGLREPVRSCLTPGVSAYARLGRALRWSVLCTTQIGQGPTSGFTCNFGPEVCVLYLSRRELSNSNSKVSLLIFFFFLLLINTTLLAMTLGRPYCTSNGRCHLISPRGRRRCQALLSRSSWPA